MTIPRRSAIIRAVDLRGKRRSGYEHPGAGSTPVLLQKERKQTALQPNGVLYPTGEELVMAEGWLDRWRTIAQDCPFPSEITPNADATTGERLTLPEEWRHLARVEAEARATAEARAEAEATRAEAETAARIAVEAKLAEAMARLQELEARTNSA